MKTTTTMLCTALSILLLAGCGLHFRNKDDYSPALRQTNISNTSPNRHLTQMLNNQLLALGLNTQSPQPTSSITITDYRFSQSIPEISDDTVPVYTTSHASLCINLTKETKKPPAPLHLCVNRTSRQITNASTAYNPSNATEIKRQLTRSLITSMVNRLQDPSVWNYLEQEHA